MTARLLPESLAATARRVRLLTILQACEAAGLAPVPIDNVHLLAYLSDALAPVWHLPILDAQILKRQDRPFFPVLQRDLDRLVGMGLVGISRLAYLESTEGDGWRLDTDYSIVHERTHAIFAKLEEFEEQRTGMAFVKEVVYAASGLGSAGVNDIGRVDATYSSPLVDVGGLIDIGDGLSLTSMAARRFRQVTEDAERFTNAELIHLYVRHLYARMQVA